MNFLDNKISRSLIVFTIAPLFFTVMVLLRPLVTIRIGSIMTSRIGHFTVNTELLLCERELKNKLGKTKFIDLFYCADSFVSNKYLLKMWSRVLIIGPKILLAPLLSIISRVPGADVHKVPKLIQGDRDVLCLLDKCPQHLTFTESEINLGKNTLLSMGIPDEAKFVCLIVRDKAYMKSTFANQDSSYHDYRDSSIESFNLASEYLASRGYFVLRMGEHVKAPFRTQNKRIIDYACSGNRTDFMDIFLGAMCDFCVTTGTGFDGIPVIFRRPIVHVNAVPLGNIRTFRSEFISITKKHLDISQNRQLTLSEIFRRGVGFSLKGDEYKNAGINLIDCSPEDIRDACLEMVDKLNGVWNANSRDEELHANFWKIFPSNKVGPNGQPWHGEIKGKYSTIFLRKNPEWVR